jgi:hypothetical protein
MILRDTKPWTTEERLRAIHVSIWFFGAVQLTFNALAILAYLLWAAR